MGLVSFSTTDTDQRPGFHIGNRIIDLATIVPQSKDEHPLINLENMEDRIWKALSADNPPATFDLADVDLHYPTDIGKIIRLEGCFEQDLSDEGFNPHLENAGLHEFEWPSLWIAPKSSAAEPDDHIKLPPGIDDVRAGVELCLVVGERAKNRSPVEALDAIAGCTIAIALRAHDEIPGLEGYKMFEGFLPLGPQVVPLDDVNFPAVDMGVKIDGELLDVRTTADWRFAPGDLVSYTSDVLTLEAGDLLTTGDPTRIERSIEPGDSVSAWIEGVGSLSVTTTGADDE